MSQDLEEREDYFREPEYVADLTKADWDVIESLINDALSRHMRTWESTDYFVVDRRKVLVKVYTREGQKEPAYTVTMILEGGRLSVVDVK